MVNDLPTLSDSDLADIPRAVVLYAQRTARPNAVLTAWLLHASGGLNARLISQRLPVPYRTVQRWLREMERDVVATKEVTKPVGTSILSAKDVATKRALLLRRAEQEDKLELQHKILDSEARRLGLDVQRVEQVSLAVQLRAMDPEQRRAELATRLARLQARGALPLPEGVASAPAPAPDAHAQPLGHVTPPGAPGPHSHSPVLDPLSTRASENGEKAMALPGVPEQQATEEGEGDAEEQQSGEVRSEGTREGTQQGVGDQDLPEVNGAVVPDRPEGEDALSETT